MSKLACWVEAMRLRTLPVSVAGVIGACGYALLDGKFKPAVAVLCLLFAVLAQIASNFANEYYDFKGGLDRKGREGPRRGVTEGDLTPGAMKAATFVTLGLACCVGLSLLLWGPWWLILAGVAIALGVLAYSTGPYPLSHHGLGEVAQFAFGEQELALALRVVFVEAAPPVLCNVHILYKEFCAYKIAIGVHQRGFSSPYGLYLRTAQDYACGKILHKLVLK